MLRRWKRAKPKATPAPDEPVAPPPGLSIDQIIAPLTSNMANAGDFSFEAIKALGNAVPLPVRLS
ncbi:hypothetical protein OHA72_49510 [Dactylosporangium sp. NBC_01737]|uniref:hypothetical protein n=1 Tax=Dactylosporangium sp. NBC_01737 TaxID=2975959 RepID=UPI002E0EBC7F|nr:hypothetical protein OHA72_49510 [Dactylosporangium sp. NBC_01737]